MANGDDIDQGNPLGDESRRPNFSTAQDETARVATPDPNDPDSFQEPGEGGEPISDEEFLLKAANRGTIDLGEEGEPITDEQFRNKVRVKVAADKLLPRLAKENYQQMREKMKEDRPGWERARSAANTAVKGLLEYVPLAQQTIGILQGQFYNLFQSEENEIDPRSTPMYRSGKSLGHGLKKAFPDSPLYRKEFLAGIVAKGAGQLTGNVVAAMATGGQSLWASGAASAGLNATLGSQYYKEAKKEGATDNEAFSNMLVNMGAVGAMEAIPMVRMLRRVNKGTRGGLLEVIKSGFKGSAEEAIQEATQTAFENFTAQEIYDSSRDIMDGVYQAAGAGALLGGVANTTMTALSDQRNFAQTWEDRIAAGEAMIKLSEDYGDIALGFDQDMSVEERVAKMKEILEKTSPDQGMQITEDTGTDMGILSPKVTPVQDLKPGSLKKLWVKYLKTGGVEGKGIQISREKRDAKIKRDLEQVQINLHKLNRKIFEEYDSNYDDDLAKAANDENDTVPSDITVKIDQALRGEETNLPSAIKEVTEDMRHHVKQLSFDFIKRGYAPGQLKTTILENFGSYVHRSYKLYDSDVKWNKETIPNDVWNRGIAFMRSKIKGELQRQGRAAQRRQDALRAMIENDVPLEQRMQELRRIEQESPGAIEPETMSEAEINREAEKRLEGVITARGPQSIHQMFQETDIAVDAGDRDVLLQRQEIPKPIREVMGEYKDGSVNYINTIHKMTTHLEKRAFFDNIADQFRGELFYTREEISDQGLDISNFRADFNDGGLNSRLTQDSEENPGLFMHEDLYDSLNRSMDPSKDMGPFFTNLLRGVSAAKYSKTVLSHVAHFRNLVGGLGFLNANGLFFQKPGAGKGSFRKALTVFKGYEKLSDQQLEKRWKKYVGLGLTSGSVRAGEIRDILTDVMDNDVTNVEQFMEENFNHSKAADKASSIYKESKSWFNKYSRKLTKLYQSEDAFLRIWMYEMEKARLQEADPNITDQEVADLVQDLYPNYDRVNQFVKDLRLAPFAPFISFPAEVVRTSINTVRRAKEEIQSDNKALNRIGYKRVSGIFSTLIGTATIGAASQALLGMTDEEEQAIRQFLPPWTRNSTIAYLTASEGEVRYINTSYTNPYEFMLDPIFAAFRGDSDRTVRQRFTDSMSELFEPIYSEELFTEAAIDLMRNRTADGREVWNPEEPLSDQIQKMYLHMWDSVEPGSISSFQRVKEPIVDTDSYRNTSDEIAGLFGMRIASADVERSFGFRIRDFRERIRNSRRVYNSVKFDEDSDRNEVRAAYERSNEAYKSIFREMKQMADAARTTGVDWWTLKDIMEESGLASRDIQAIRTGSFQPFER